MSFCNILRRYDVSLAEGSYTVVVLVTAFDPKQVVPNFITGFVFSLMFFVQLEDDYKQTVPSTLPFRIKTALSFTFNSQTALPPDSHCVHRT